MNGVTTGRATGWMTGKTTGIGTVRGSARANGTMMKVPIWCVESWARVRTLNQQSDDKVKLMIDSGSKSTACSVDFAKGDATDETERAKLWGIQDQKIEEHGKKIVDVKFHGQANETPVPARIKVDVSDVARKVASMVRLLRAGFDLHFTNHGHTCWTENGGLKTTISEDSPTSEAPLCSLDLEVLPPLRDTCKSKPAPGARVAPIAADEERVEESSRVELAGLVRDIGLNGKRGICMGRAPDGEGLLTALPGGRRINVKMSNIKPAADLNTLKLSRERGHERGSAERS